MSQVMGKADFPLPLPPLREPMVPQAYLADLSAGSQPLNVGPFTMAELNVALAASKDKRRGGPSGMIVEQLKSLSQEVREDLLRFYQKCFDSSSYPEAWARAE
eukprot:14517365-Alexandrium_andersonii.AAC.1